MGEKIDRAVMPGVQGGTFMNVVAAKAIACQEAMHPSFVTYQKQVVKNAQAMAKEFQNLGYRVVSGGTDTHLFLVDLADKGLTGKQAEQLLESHGIYVNRNLIPFDSKPPLEASGIRIGTPAITSVGITEEVAMEIVRKIDKFLTFNCFSM